MWETHDIRQELERARKELKLTEAQFRPLGLTEWPAVEKRMYLEFTVQTGKLARWRWPWAHPTPKKPHAWLPFDCQDPVEQLPRLVDPNETYFVFFEDTVNEQTKFWWYQGQIDAIVAVINDIWFCEIGLMSKHYEWLLYLDHHDSTIGIGAPMVARIQQLTTQAT